MPRRTPILRRPITRWSLTILCIAIFATWCANFFAREYWVNAFIYHSGDTNYTRLHWNVGAGATSFGLLFDPPLDSLDTWRTSLTLERPRQLPPGLVLDDEPILMVWLPDLKLRFKPDPKFATRQAFFLTLPLWIPFALLSLLTWRSWNLHLAHRAALRTHHCPHCNYSRTGLTPSSPCPECGTTAANPSTM